MNRLIAGWPSILSEIVCAGSSPLLAAEGGVSAGIRDYSCSGSHVADCLYLWRRFKMSCCCVHYARRKLTCREWLWYQNNYARVNVLSQSPTPLLIVVNEKTKNQEIQSFGRESFSWRMVAPRHAFLRQPFADDHRATSEQDSDFSSRKFWRKWLHALSPTLRVENRRHSATLQSETGQQLKTPIDPRATNIFMASVFLKRPKQDSVSENERYSESQIGWWSAGQLEVMSLHSQLTSRNSITSLSVRGSCYA